MTFSKQVLIKHFVSATERGLLRLETANLVSVTGFAECDRDDCTRSLGGKLFIFTTLYSFSLLTDSPVCIFLASATFVSFRSITFSHFSLSSESPLVCCQSHPLRPETNTDVYATTTTTTNKQSAAAALHRDINLPRSWFVIARTDGQSKAHHTFGVENKLKCACLWIPFQNQYLSGEI